MLMRFLISRAKTAEKSASVRLGRLWLAEGGESSARFVSNAVRLVLALSGVSVASALQLTVAWDSTAGATGYKVERSTNGTTFTQVASVSTPSYTDLNLTLTTYWYRVRAFNATTTSAYSNVAKYSSTTSSTSTPSSTTTSTSAPKITTQPLSQVLPLGTTAKFSVAVTGSPVPTIQWRKNGVNISGATASTLTVSNVSYASEGSYTAVIKNSAGSVTSSAASLTIVQQTVTALTSLLTDAFVEPGRLGQISARAIPGTGAQALTLTAKIVNASKNILMRGVGPGLDPYTDSAVLFDPKLSLYTNGTLIASNDNWGGTWALSTTFSRVGAFPLTSTSRDAALLKSLPAGTHQTITTGDNTGIALAEIYDADSLHPPAGRITRLFAQSKVRTGEGVMVVGFTVIGDKSLKVLIRAIGPSLAGVSGTLLDPQMSLYKGTTLLQYNDNWGGGSTLASVFNTSGAASLSTSSKDSAIYCTLAPGAYTAVVSGVNSTSGVARVEIYEVP